jgi:hypothetical protein
MFEKAVSKRVEVNLPPGRSAGVPVIHPRRNMVHTGARRGIRRRKKQSRHFFNG